MAKSRDEIDLKRLVDDLYKIIQTTNAQSIEQVKINKELLKVMTLLQSGFVKNEEDARKLIDDVREGLEVQDEYAIKWAKARKAEKHDIDDIIKKFREIEKLQEEEIDNAKDYIELLSDRYDLLDDEFGITQRLISSNKEIQKIIKNNKKIYDTVGGSVGSVDDVLKKIIDKKVDLNNLFSGTVQSITAADDLVEKIKTDISTLTNNISSNVIDLPVHFNPLTGDLDKEVSQMLSNIEQEKQSRIQGLEQYFDKNKKMQLDLSRSMAAQMSGMDIKVDVDTGDIIKGSDKLISGTKEYDKIIKKLDKISLDKNLGSELQDNFKEIGNLIGLSGARTDEQNHKLNELLTPLGLSNKLMIEQLSYQIDDLDVITRTVQKQKDKYTVLSKNLDLLRSTEKVLYKIGNAFDYVGSLLPRGLSDMIGLSGVTEKLLSNHRKAIETMVDKLGEGSTRADAIRSYYQEMAPSLKSLITPMNVLVVGGLMLFKYVSGVTDKLKEMAFEMQISISQSRQLLDSQLDILTSHQNQFATLKDIQAIQTEFIGTSGKYYSAIDKGNQQFITQIADMGRAFGYGASEAAKIHKTFNDLGADNELSAQLQGSLGLMSEMVGLSPQIIGKDLLDSSETVFTYFAGMPGKAAEAALNVRKLGLSLKQAGSIAQKMLDIEGFMTDMYELYAMSGQKIDFSEAFDLGLMGDIEGMTKSIMKNIGTSANLAQMDNFERMKIAKTLGITVEELVKGVKMHEQMSQFYGDERIALEANADRLGDISKLNQQQIRQKLQDLQSTDRLAVAWDKIKGVFVKSLLPLVEAFADGIDAISPLIDLIVGSLKIVGTLIKPIAQLIKGFLAPLKFVADILDKVIGKWFKMDDATGSINSNMDKLGGVVKGIGTALGTWYFGKKLLGGFGLIKSEGTGLKAMIGGIGASFSEMFRGGTKQTQMDVEKVNKSVQSIEPVIETTKNKSKSAANDIISNIETSSKKVNTEIQKSGQVAASTLKKVKKNNNGLFSNLGASEGFGTVKSIATKTLAFLAVDQARIALGFGTSMKEGITENQAGIQNAMGGIFSVGGVLLSTYLDDAMTKVFEKKMEKRFEGGMKPLKGIAGNTFDKIGGMTGRIIDPIKERSKNAFDIITNYAKKVLPGPFSILEQGLNKIKPKKVLEETIETTKTITDTAKNVDVNETFNKSITHKKRMLEIPTQNIPKSFKLPEVEQTKVPDTSMFDKLKDKFNNLFTSIGNIVKKGWDTIKSVFNDILDFVIQVGTKISKGIGDIVNNLLTGIADGLNKFTTNSVKGAASLLIVSGALWVTSKSLQNFASVSWEDIGKGIVTLGGLVGAGILLGQMSGSMIKGAIAIGLLGASLIPATYALEKFNKVDWMSLAKAGAAIVGLGVIGNVLGPMLPTLAMGAIGIAALGASIIPLAYSLKMLNDVEWSSIGKGIVGLLAFGVVGSVIGATSPLLIAGSIAIVSLSASLLVLNGSLALTQNILSNLDTKNINKLTDSLLGLTSISSIQLFGIAAGITAIAGALVGFTVSDIFNNVGNLFGGSIIDDLKELAGMVDPLDALSLTILSLGGSLQLFSKIINGLDLNQLDKLNNLSDINLDITKKSSLFTEQDKNQNITYTNDVKPIRSVATPLPPKPEVTAQNISIQKTVEKTKEIETHRQNQLQEELEFNTDSLDGLSTKKLEQLMVQLLQKIDQLNDRPIQVNLDTQALNSSLKKFNNK